MSYTASVSRKDFAKNVCLPFIVHTNGRVFANENGPKTHKSSCNDVVGDHGNDIAVLKCFNIQILKYALTQYQLFACMPSLFLTYIC